MKPILSLAVTSAVLCLAQCLPISSAQAQLMRTFVSAASGNDANDCNRLTPCRSFQGAHDKTLDQGEITVLDAGGYGAVTITKAISIVNDGAGEAGILVSGGAIGITVNAPAAAHVSLRGINVQGIGFGGGTGLLFNGGFALTITDCIFRNHAGGSGIEFHPNVGGISNLSIMNTLIADNGGSGMFISPNVPGVTTQAVMNRVRILNNASDGLLIDGRAGGTVQVTMTDSISAANGRNGLLVASAPSPGISSLTLVRSMVASNKDTGLVVASNPPASLLIADSIIAGNAKTWNIFGSGALRSFGNNYIVGNADGDPALPATIARK